MPVEVRPTEFSMVFFDAAEIQGIVEKLVAEIGLPGDLSVTVEIDETTPMGRARVASIDPLVITAESGALEDVKAPRQLSEAGHARRDRQAAVLRARPARPRLRRAARRRRPHASRSRWRGRCTASAGSAGSATRCSASAGSTSSATATASPMPPTPRSTRLWDGRRPHLGRHLRHLPGGPRRPPRLSYFKSWARSARGGRSAGGPARRPAQPSAIVTMSARVEVGLLVLGPLPLLHDHEAVRLRRGHGQVDVAAARGGRG